MLQLANYIIIASVPSQRFDDVESKAKAAPEPRNILCAWGRADDVASGIHLVD